MSGSITRILQTLVGKQAAADIHLSFPSRSDSGEDSLSLSSKPSRSIISCARLVSSVSSSFENDDLTTRTGEGSSDSSTSKTLNFDLGGLLMGLDLDGGRTLNFLGEDPLCDDF